MSQNNVIILGRAIRAQVRLEIVVVPVARVPAE